MSPMSSSSSNDQMITLLYDAPVSCLSLPTPANPTSLEQPDHCTPESNTPCAAALLSPLTPRKRHQHPVTLVVRLPSHNDPRTRLLDEPEIVRALLRSSTDLALLANRRAQALTTPLPSQPFPASKPDLASRPRSAGMLAAMTAETADHRSTAIKVPVVLLSQLPNFVATWRLLRWFSRGQGVHSLSSPSTTLRAGRGNFYVVTPHPPGRDRPSGSPHYREPAIEVHVQRARKLHVHFYASLEHDADSQIQMLRYLIEHSVHWEEACLEVTAELAPLLLSLRDRIPALRKIWLDWIDEDGEAAAPSLDYLQSASSLVDLGLYRRALPVIVFPPVNQLTRYHVEGACWNTHWAILKANPNLVVAHISDFRAAPEWDAPSEVIHLSRLRCLLPCLEQITLGCPQDQTTIDGAILDRFISDTSSRLRRLGLRGQPHRDFVRAIVQRYTSITELAILIRPVTGSHSNRFDDDSDETVLDLANLLDVSGDVVVAPRLSHFYLAFEGALSLSNVGYGSYLQMLTSRLNLLPRTLQAATIFYECELEPTADLIPAPHAELELLAQAGVGFSCSQAASFIGDSGVMLRWMCAQEWPYDYTVQSPDNLLVAHLLDILSSIALALDSHFTSWSLWESDLILCGGEWGHVRAGGASFAHLHYDEYDGTTRQTSLPSQVVGLPRAADEKTWSARQLRRPAASPTRHDGHLDDLVTLMAIGMTRTAISSTDTGPFECSAPSSGCDPLQSTLWIRYSQVPASHGESRAGPYVVHVGGVQGMSPLEGLDRLRYKHFHFKVAAELQGRGKLLIVKEKRNWSKKKGLVHQWSVVCIPSWKLQPAGRRHNLMLRQHPRRRSTAAVLKIMSANNVNEERTSLISLIGSSDPKTSRKVGAMETRENGITASIGGR
ncbi:hypothetical protein FB45DRAFT_1130500 [Roridomyces roridus]|uniref:Uncharacterized protein n=1 Tax=Roridomyces roridus TaxID=1738132 RepID=A0AAD7F9Z5_9AGAR|nr:hypothetical protein FB45DRAFT_1130500 [Roridomyces roridus]